MRLTLIERRFNKASLGGSLIQNKTVQKTYGCQQEDKISKMDSISEAGQ